MAGASDLPVYLDNNATTAIDPRVLERMQECWKSGFANPGSQHAFGRAARTILEDSRESIAEILNADASEVIFTSGGTEAINASVYGFTFGRRGTLAATAGEHPAASEACQIAINSGWKQVTLTVDSNSRLEDALLDQLPWTDLKLVCVILAHNETGVIQDVQRLSSLCLQHGVPLLLDAVQAVGKMPVDFQALGATAVAFGAHKFHGPRGVGGLLLRRGVKLPPFLVGGYQESGRRAGTEAVPLIAGMAKALEVWHLEHADRDVIVRSLRDRLQSGLMLKCPSAIVHGLHANRLANTLSIAFPGVAGEALLVNLHLAGIACSLGSTCASGSVEPAKSLLAMGVAPDICKSSVRFSLSYQNTVSEIDWSINKIATLVSRLQTESVS
jgi:cysteine desulfurase